MCPHPSRFSMRSVAVALALLGSIGAVLLVSAPTVSATTYVRGVSATDSSPEIISNKVIQAGAGFVFLRSSSYVSSNTIIRATNVGVYANASSVQISGNAINNTAVGIQIEQPGFPTVSGNTITNGSSGFAMGILVTGGATASIVGNTGQGIPRSPGTSRNGPGAPGRAGPNRGRHLLSRAPAAPNTSHPR